jgi:hypothetical protein
MTQYDVLLATVHLAREPAGLRGRCSKRKARYGSNSHVLETGEVLTTAYHNFCFLA